MNSVLASNSSLSSVDALPWWVQLFIGLGLLIVGFGLRKFNERDDAGSDAIAFITFLLNVAAIVVVVNALF